MATKEQLVRAASDAFARQALDRGKLVEYGWRAYRLVAVPKDASTQQLEERKNAFYHGAQHLFASIMQAMTEGDEPTAADMRRMSYLNDELNEFSRQETLRFSKPEGHG